MNKVSEIFTTTIGYYDISVEESMRGNILTQEI